MPGVARDVAAGLVVSLVTLANSVSYGALIFTGPLEPFIGRGVASALITGATTAIVIAALSNFRTAIAAPVANTTAPLAAMLATLAPALAAARGGAVTLALAALGLATLLTGAVLLLLGWRRLGRLVRFVPYPVAAGFMASTGWLMLSGAVHMVTGIPVSLASLAAFATPQIESLLALTAVWAMVLGVVISRLKHVLTLPVALCGAALATDAALCLLGVSDKAHLLFNAGEGRLPPIPLLTGEFFRLDWTVLRPVLGDMAAVAAISCLSVLMTTTGVELAARVEANLDHELKVHGLANIASGLLGGFVGQISLTHTSLNTSAGAKGRLSGIVVGLVFLGALMGGSAAMAYVPRFVLGGLLILLGGRLLWDWGAASRRKLPLREWLLVVAIILITASVGFVQALLFGVLAGCVIFAVDVSRIGVVRYHFGLDERPSSLVRSAEEMLVLTTDDAVVRVLQLSSFVFFGSAYRLQHQVKALIDGKSARMVILDFSAVTGIDSSAGAAFARIRDLLRDAGIRQVMVGLSPAMAHILIEAGGLDRRVDTYAALDEALEEGEKEVLTAHKASHGARDTLDEWLEEMLGGAEPARILAGFLVRSEHAAGAYLCRQGDPTDTLIFIERGRVSVIVERQGQPPTRVRAFGGHTIVGEIGFFLDAPRSATLRVDSETTVWSLSRDGFDRLRAGHMTIVLALFTYVVRVQAERLTFATKQIAAFQR